MKLVKEKNNKVCSKCGLTKPLNEFYAKRGASDGHRAECKQCKNARLYRWRQCNSERLRAIAARYRATDRGKAKKRLWNTNNLDKVRASDRRKRGTPEYRDWRSAYERSAKVRAYRAWYKSQPHRRKADKEANKTPEARAYRRAYRRKMFQKLQTRVHNAMSCRIRTFVTKGRVSWPNIVGYSADELMLHLQRQFHSGMNWNNYGKHGWHIDHIVPASSFTFGSVTEPEFRQCWALTNLRPCWAAENYRKHAKRVYLL